MGEVGIDDKDDRRGWTLLDDTGGSRALTT